MSSPVEKKIAAVGSHGRQEGRAAPEQEHPMHLFHDFQPSEVGNCLAEVRLKFPKFWHVYRSAGYACLTQVKIEILNLQPFSSISSFSRSISFTRKANCPHILIPLNSIA